MNYTKNMGLRKPEGGEYYSIEDFNTNVDTLDAVVFGKADKPTSFTLGNLTSVGVGGNLEDSGKKPYDFAGAEHSHDTAYAPISHVNNGAIHVSADEKAAIATVASKADRVYVDSALSTKANQREVMAHGSQTLLNLSSVLAMASSVTVDTSIFSYVGTNLTEAADSPAPNSEMQYLVLMDYGDRRTVLAIQYTNADPEMWIREIYQAAWRKNKWTKIAIATPTQEISVPLASGYTG